MSKTNLIGDTMSREERLAPTEHDYILSAVNRIGARFSEWVRARNEREAINFFLDLLVSKHGKTIKHYQITRIKTL